MTLRSCTPNIFARADARIHKLPLERLSCARVKLPDAAGSFRAALWWNGYDEADKPCRNVFELGLKTYMDVPAYVLTYTNH